MPDRVSLELTTQSKRNLRKLAKMQKISLRGGFKSIGASYRKEVKGIYNKQQPRLSGLRWPDLSEDYAEQKAREYPGAPILVASGRLRDSMIKLNHPDNISKIGKLSASFGSSVPYGTYHDSLSPRRKLPLRNFSIPSEGRLENFRKVLEVTINKQFKANGIEVNGVFK
jgi:hypothetical protein